MHGGGVLSKLCLLPRFILHYQHSELCNTEWKHVTEINDLHHLINKPTRIIGHSESIKDHLYTSTPEFSSISVSDHYPVQFTRFTCKKTTAYHNMLSII